MSKRILLIKPDFQDIAVLPPLGLGYLASALKAKGYDVRIHDNTLMGFDDDRLRALMREYAPSIVGVGAVTPMINRGLSVIGLAKQVLPDVLTVIGGPHPTAVPEETMEKCGDLDVTVLGEGEESLPAIAERFFSGTRDFSGIAGCMFRNGGEVVKTAARSAIQDLDKLPFPALDDMPIERYMKEGKNFGVLQKTSRSIPIIASRGCPADCTFCMRFLGRKLRVRSAENIVAEVEERIKKYGVREFNFLDDNFTLHKKRAIETCELIHKRGLNIKFRFPNGVREDFLTEETLAALKSVGCYHLDFGIESGSQRVLDIMQKGKKVEEIAEKVHLCKRNGFKISASFLFGTPGETLDDMRESIRFATSLPLDSASFGIIIPFPGTALREEAIRKGYLLHSDYDYYNISLQKFRPILRTPEWGEKELYDMLKTANRAFFMRPRQIIRLLPTMFNPFNAARYLAAFVKVIKG